MIDYFHHITCPFPSFKISKFPKWKGRYKNTTILVVPGVIIVVHAPYSRDRVKTSEIIVIGSTYLVMIYIRSCFAVMTTHSKDRVVRSSLISNHHSRLSFSMYEIMIYLFLVCILFHACSVGKIIAPRLRQFSKAGDRTLNILKNI
jgi:uncharacterized protein with PQ loop repeat